MFRHRFAPVAIAAFALSATGAAQQPQPQAAAPARQAEAGQISSSRTAAQLVNIRLELAIKEQRGSGPAQERVVTLLLGDRENGRVRSGQSNAMVNVDARPEIVRDGKIKVSLAIEYRPLTEGDKAATLLTESLSIVLDDGKPLVVSQSADPAPERSGVSVQLTATVLR